ncbi:N utilization substance protein B [Motilibacter peucedani]|uniref:Transcription antitermination protein NusB n=1 Tax=Motilibacter peucedani TaxID=598650 RepID=A0A420XSG5_9ACTN|nr:transcription antitermination factor NusB [Motilibacter peucedani]RKS77770.1 N utilization substance protein B [Motilibacter peucedani]
MSARHKARKRALDVLYESEARSRDPLTTLTERRARNTDLGPEDEDYAVELVRGVVGARDRIDALLGEHAVGWELDRMPAVDRAILRIGAYEVLERDDVPDEVALAEAVALAEELSTEDSPQFVNGLLGKLARVKP